MFNDRYNYRPDHTTNTDLPAELPVRITEKIFRGERKWYAEVVPQEWERTERGYVNKVVVNLPRGAEAFPGEAWHVRLCRKQPARGVLFADGVRKIVNPEGVPSFFEAGMQLIVADCPENEGTRVRRTGIVREVQVIRVAGSDWLDVVFDDLETSVIHLASGRLPQLVGGNIMRLTRLHKTGLDWHAYHGDKLVQLCRG